jgi:phosphate transport system permease protein
MTLALEKRPRSRAPLRKRERVQRRATALFAHGEPMVWLAGGALALALCMIVGLLALIAWNGAATFWPARLVRIETTSGKVWMGEVTSEENYIPTPEALAAVPPDLAETALARVAAQGGRDRRRMLRIANFEITGAHFKWIADLDVREESRPEWALAVERRSWGHFYGFPKAFVRDGETVATKPGHIWKLFEAEHDAALARFQRKSELETRGVGAVNRELESSRLRLRKIELAHGRSSPEYAEAAHEAESSDAALRARIDAIQKDIAAIDAENARTTLVLETADRVESKIALSDVVRAYPANRLGLSEQLTIYASRWWEFLTDVPRDNNNEGGVFPAIFGTVVMTLVMSLLVVPFGVLAALYLREYAKPGPLVSFVRIAVNNLAGVPSIVFGVFGLGFFCYIVGASIDELLFSARLPNPTLGKGGVLWSSLTLAMLTLPVVIVATEEALAAVPGSMREGSYACGATKWQTIQRIVLPRALPGIMTGMILAIARGAGEVAPLMLVGAVKLAPELALDGTFPYLHPERSFMHLGFHIYDLGFQSPNSEAAKPMVFTTTLLLIAIIVGLNIAAIGVRSRLRRRFTAVQV